LNIYNSVSSEWDETVCGGGVWWNTDHKYKNAITNELFLLTSAVGYQLTRQQSYLDNANKAWAWLYNSGMRNSDGLWNDGLDSNCRNNGENTWTYNQGVIASGLGALASITSNKTLLEEAELTMDAAVIHLTVDGFVKEICDDATHSTCDGDSVYEQGLMMKHWQYYLDFAADSARTAKYSAFSSKQSEGALRSKTPDNDIGSNWYTTTGSLISVQSTTAGLEAIIAAAKVSSISNDR
ncbi:glycoside hydrolase, partial [Amylostereum chailletii]